MIEHTVRSFFCRCLPGDNMAVKSPFMIEGYYPKESTEYLRMEFELRKRRNSQYSIRAFARDLNLSPSHLSEFLSGKTSLSPSRVEKLSERLGLNLSHREHWNDLLLLKSRKASERKAARLKVARRIKESKSSVSLETFRVISDWYHFAMVAFFGANAGYSLSELESSLGVPIKKLKSALARLIRLGLLEKTSEGFRPSTSTSFAGDALPSEAIREAHRQVLVKATQALTRFDMSERESQSLFFSVPEDKVEQLRSELKKRIFETLSEYAEENLPKNKVSVQAFTWHLFPLKNHQENL